MKKHFFPVKITLAVLLASLVVSCFSPSGGVRQKEGSGTITVRLAGNNGRTVLPDDPVFDSYDLEFTPLSGQTPFPDNLGEGLPAADFISGKDVTLAEGDWKITATGYVEFEGDSYPVATGDTNVTVIADQDGEAIITVGDVDIGTGNGILEYDLDLYAATGITLEVLDINGDPLTPAVSTTDKTGSEVLPAGYYIVKLTVQGNTVPNVVTKIVVVHIYSYLTTTITADENLNLIKKGNQLPLIYKVEDDDFVGTYESGQKTKATLESAATIVDSTQPDGTTPNNVRAVNTGNGGYIALGGEVGALLKKLDEWTLETYVFIPDGYDWSGNGHHILGFAQSRVVNAATSAIGPTMWLAAKDLEFTLCSQGWGGTTTGSSPVVTPAADPRGNWKHVVVTMGTDKVSVYMDGKLVRQGPNSGQTLQKTTTLNAFQYGYLGQSLFYANTAANDQPLRNTQYYQFGVYEGEMSLADIWDNAQTVLTELNGVAPAYPAISDFTFLPVIGLTDDDALPGVKAGEFINPVGGIPPYGAYSLVTGEGDDDNDKFDIVGTELKVGATALTVGKKTVRVRVVDSNNSGFEKIIEVSIVRPEPILVLDFSSDTLDATVGHAVMSAGSLSFTDGPGTGALSRAAEFSGSSTDYIVATANGTRSLLTKLVPDTEDPDDPEKATVSGLESYSVVFWLKPANGYPSWWSFAAKNSNVMAAPENYIGLARVSANPNGLNMERFYNGRPNNPAGNTGAAELTANNVIVEGTWMHIAFVNGKDYISMYVNGVEVGTKVGITKTIEDILSNASVYYIGHSTWGSTGEAAYGAIADYRVYDGPLNAGRVEALYDEGALSVVVATVTAQLGGTSPSVATNMNLPTTYGGASITWESDDTSVLDHDGTLVATRPAYGNPVVDTANLTATFTYKNEAPVTQVFAVSVRPEMQPPILSLTFDSSGIVNNSSTGYGAIVGTLSTVSTSNHPRSHAYAVRFDNAVGTNHIRAYKGSSGTINGLLPKSVSGFTVELWVKRNNDATSWLFTIQPEDVRFNYGTTSETYFGLRYRNSRDLASDRFYLGRAGNAAGRVATEFNTGANSVPNNNTDWTHVAYVVTNSYTRVYINGVLRGSEASPPTTLGTISGILGGSNNLDASVFYIGKARWQDSSNDGEGCRHDISRFRVYDSAVDGEEVRALYQN